MTKEIKVCPKPFPTYTSVEVLKIIKHMKYKNRKEKKEKRMQINK
jgi:hypothetical protein